MSIRSALLLLASAVIFVSGGCVMCPSPSDYTFSAFGGSWQRDDMHNGRVGSAFTPAGFAVDEGDSGSESAEEAGEESSPDGPYRTIEFNPLREGRQAASDAMFWSAMLSDSGAADDSAVDSGRDEFDVSLASTDDSVEESEDDSQAESEEEPDEDTDEDSDEESVEEFHESPEPNLLPWAPLR